MIEFLQVVPFMAAFGGLIWFGVWAEAHWVNPRRARRDIRLISAAIKGYLETYKRLPIVDQNRDEQSTGTVLTILRALHVTIYTDETGVAAAKEVPAEIVARENPKLINFLSTPLSREKYDHRMCDPWGQDYHIALDRDGDCMTDIETERTNYIGVGHRVEDRRIQVKIVHPAAVWSSGPDRRNDLGDGDDITNWK